MKADKTEVKNIVTALEVLKHFDVSIKGNYCKCFIHGGENYKMKIFKDGVVCMSVCHASLDIFGIVQHFMSCDFVSALDYICSVWGIPNDNEPLSEFDKLRFDIKRMTDELTRLDQDGRAAVLYNRLADAWNIPKRDVNAIRMEYKRILISLREAKAKLRNERFDNDIDSFFNKIHVDTRHNDVV